MPVIDIHNHVTPQVFRDAIEDRGEWFGLGPDVGELHIPKFSISPEDRMAEMDEMGVDMHCLTINTGFFQYSLDAEVTKVIARECNDELARWTRGNPDRFSALASLPMQDVPAAIAEMERAMSELRVQGVTIGDHIAGKMLDEPEFRPFWRSVEELGAVVFFHQCSSTVVEARTAAIRVAEHDRQLGGSRDHVRHARVRRRDGRVPRPEDLPRTRRRIRGVRDRADGQGLARRRDG